MLQRTDENQQVAAQLREAAIRGALAGQRVVRGREAECRTHE